MSRMDVPSIWTAVKLLEKDSIVIEKVQKYKHLKILLGGYAKRDKWYWLSGKEIDFPLKKDSQMPIPSANCNYITLFCGEFYNSQYNQLLLCEWRINSQSSN